MMQKEIFAEVGFGNKSFLSTEVENGKIEYRLKGFIIPKKTKGIYIRIWIWKTAVVLSTLNRLEIIKKNKSKFKLVFGIRGTDR